MLYWARWTCDRDSASEAMRTPTARDRVNSQSASFSLPNLPRPIGEQVVNSGHKAYGTATAVCHTASWLAPNDHLATIVCPPSCDITIIGRLSGNEGMPPVCSAPATTGQCLCVQLCRSSSRPTGTRGGTKCGTLQVKKPLPEGKQTPALLDRYVSLQVQLTKSDRVIEGQYFIGNWYHRTVTSCKRHRQPGVIFNERIENFFTVQRCIAPPVLVNRSIITVGDVPESQDSC
ncbi:hypothetical protein T10_170 [Trichinella papuae]|uniref:Uncharacterized protein n=1 Tax=Trichinella papuae TaxID=268474 RepID=A0A0V1MNP8_9BILA|nr:hypothetical protein T10_170 [Trichinella papuae]